MKKTSLLASLVALTATSITPVIALASCNNSSTTIKAIPESMLDIRGNILFGLKDIASLNQYDTLAIPENVIAIGEEAFKDVFVEDANSSTIKTIVFNKNLKTIGSSAFENCSSLTCLDLTAMEDINVMSLRLADSTTFSSCSNKSGRVKLPEGITDIQLSWIKEMFEKAGLPGSWFGDIEAPDQETVDAINAILEGKTFKTMSNLIDYVYEQSGYDLEALVPTNTNEQYVWDAEKNKVIEIDQNGNLTCGPKDYKLEAKPINIWKMVKPTNASKAIKASVTNEDEIYADNFSSTTPYSQYLRSDYDWNQVQKELSFQAGLDTGEQEQLVLKYIKPDTEIDETPVIYTMKSSLTIEGSRDSIDHYGNLTELTVTSLGSGESYNEYGSVDSVIKVKSGTINAQDGSDVNEIVITADNASDVKITVQDGGAVGSVAATDEDVAEVLKNNPSSVVTTEGTPEVTPTIKETTVEEPSEENEFYSGDGTVKSPWCIKTYNQLKNFAAKFNDASYTPTDGRYYFNLVADITIPDGQTWTPVGTYAKPFKGVFNGCGFSIKNLKVDTPSSHTTSETFVGFMGLFGFTNDEANSGFDYASRETIWDAGKKELNKDVFKESEYKTAIKNLSLDNVSIRSTNESTQENGAVVGRALNTYFENVHVNSGEVYGKKAIGGIAGALAGCVLNNCSTGTYGATESDNLTVTADKYHVGGMTGACVYDEVDANICEAFIGCTNNAFVKQNNNGGTTGYAGGLVGICQNDTADHGYTVFEDCINNGDVTAVAGSVSGIAEAKRTWIYNRCINTGDLLCSNDSHTANLNMAGMGVYGIAKCYDCHNYGDITGWCDYMAGVLACGTSGGLDNVGLDDCTNSGALTATNAACIKGTIASGQKTLILKNETYDTVTDLNNALSSFIGQSINIELIDVTVTHPETGTLQLPELAGTIISNTHIADTMNITNTATGYMYIDIAADDQHKGMNINVNASCPNADIRNYSDYSTLTIASGATCQTAAAAGVNSTIVNNGTVTGGLRLDGYATECTNNGTCSSVSFGSTYCGFGHGIKHLTNNGTIKTTASGNNQHVLFSIGGSDCSITVDNYGTIEYYADSQFTSTYGYLMCLYNTSETNNVINCYSNSKIITSHPDSFRFSLKTNTDIYYQSGAEFKAGSSTIEWSKLAGGKVSVHQMQ